jgi:hypothetical protein
MPNRTAKFVSAILIGALASAVLIVEVNATVSAGDNCLSGPKGAPPKGGHWYYRVDHATKRHCWYVGDEREKQTASQNSSSPTKTALPKTDTAMQKSIADAHAELTDEVAGGKQPNAIRNEQAAPSIPAAAAVIESGSASQNGLDAQRPMFASRWADASSTGRSIDPTPRNPDARMSPNRAATTLPAGQLAADVSSETVTGSMQTLLMVILGALALAGIMGAAIFKFGSTRRIDQHEVRDHHHTIWDVMDARSTPAHPAARPPAREVDIPIKRREAAVPNEIAELLFRLSRDAADHRV